MGVFATKQDMAKTFQRWDKETFGHAFHQLKHSTNLKDNETIDLLGYVLKAQTLFHRPMNGYCSQNRIVTNEEGLKIWFSVFINELEENDAFWTPLGYLYGVCKHIVDNKECYEKMAAESRFKCTYKDLAVMICGRALRNLPSFVREFQMVNAVIERFPSGKFEKSVVLDLDGHCDLKMIYNGIEYRFWSFQSTSRGIKNFKSKFKQERGRLVNCVHVTCPIDTSNKDQTCDYLGWRLYDRKTVDYICDLIVNQKFVDYSVINMENTDFSIPMAINKSK